MTGLTALASPSGTFLSFIRDIAGLNIPGQFLRSLLVIQQRYDWHSKIKQGQPREALHVFLLLGVWLASQILANLSGTYLPSTGYLAGLTSPEVTISYP